MEPLTLHSATSVDVPSGVVVHVVIKLLHALGLKSVQIHRQFFSAYGEVVMSESIARRWVQEGRNSLEEKSGRVRPTFVTDKVS